MGQQLSDKIVGPVFFGDPRQRGERSARQYARHTIIDQLTFDPNWGFTGQLPADGAVVLAWSDRELLPVEIEGQSARRTGNVLWFLPDGRSRSAARRRSAQDLLRNTVVSSDAAFFSKDPFSISFGRGTAELSYRPIALRGHDRRHRSWPSASTSASSGFAAEPKPIEPLDDHPATVRRPAGAGCVQPGSTACPEVELYDLTTGTWRRLPAPRGGSRYAVAEPGQLRRPGHRHGARAAS